MCILYLEISVVVLFLVSQVKTIIIWETGLWSCQRGIILIELTDVGNPILTIDYSILWVGTLDCMK